MEIQFNQLSLMLLVLLASPLVEAGRFLSSEPSRATMRDLI